MLIVMATNSIYGGEIRKAADREDVEKIKSLLVRLEAGGHLVDDHRGLGGARRGVVGD